MFMLNLGNFGYNPVIDKPQTYRLGFFGRPIRGRMK